MARLTPAGYSGTPLAKKLGITDRRTVCPLGAPDGYKRMLAPLPDGVRFVGKVGATTDVVHLFVTRRAQLAKRLESLRSAIRSDAAIWVSWPKKSARTATDVTEDVIRAEALPLGFVDVKVCAVDETWSGLKLVIRVSERRA